MTAVRAEAERARVELGVVAEDDLLLLEPRQALGHRGRGEPDATAELGEAEAGVGLELGEQS